MSHQFGCSNVAALELPEPVAGATHGAKTGSGPYRPFGCGRHDLLRFLLHPAQTAAPARK
jgi:hypothetical protein